MFEQPQKIMTELVLDGPVPKASSMAAMVISNYFLPIYVQVESTTKCNLKCKLCRRTNDVNSDMPLQLFKSIIDQLKNSNFVLRRLDLTGLGEPLFHPNLVNMIKYATDYGFKVSLTSNFTLINKENSLDLIDSELDYLYVSFDGASKSTFEKMRIGTNFEKIVDKVKLFIKMRKELNSKKPKLMFETTISEDNVQEVPQIVELAESLRVDGIYFFREVKPGKRDYADDSFSLMDLKDLAKSSIEILVNQPDKAGFCVGMFGCYITFDGKVLPCNRLIQLASRKEYVRYQFGDLNRNSLSEIWFSDSYKRFRRRLALGMTSSFCKSCPTKAC